MPFLIRKTEPITDKLQFALLLRDGVADSEQLFGCVKVTSDSIVGKQKGTSGTFLFDSLKPGTPTLKVSCGPDTPYYIPKTISVTVPMPSLLWPAYPDVTIADPSLPLGDSGQTAAYKAQRAEAMLLPTTEYPFASGSTLIRGTVRHAGAELPGATVKVASGTDPSYTTGPKDGQFVLFISKPPGLPTAVTITASAPGLTDVSVNVTVQRGLTVPATIDM